MVGDKADGESRDDARLPLPWQGGSGQEFSVVEPRTI
jgi:hypothetical protein